MVKLTIDDQEVSVPEGTTILKAAESLGINIPTLCYHPKLSPIGACRVCIVEVEGENRPVASCDTPAREGMVVRTNTEATAIDVEGQTVVARDLSSGEEHVYPWDDLVIATGGSPLRPPIPGSDLPGVHGVQHLNDGADLLESIHRDAKRGVVVGAGYIGIEMAEAMQSRGLEVTILDIAEQPMRTLDPDMGELIADEMEGIRFEKIS